MFKEAWSAVEEAGLPPEIQSAAFREAVRLIAGGAQSARSTGASALAKPPIVGNRTVPGASNGEVPGSGVSESEIYDRVVRQTGVDRAKLEELLHLDGDELRISVPGLRLGNNNADRTRAVAQLLSISRGFGFEEGETPLEVVRAECIRLKVYDRPNFSTQIGRLNGFVVSGSGQNRRIRAKSAGIEAFASFVDGLLPGS
jgi:hypothetical protein